MMKRRRRIQPGLGKWFLAAAIAPDLTRNAPCTIAENRGRCSPWFKSVVSKRLSQLQVEIKLNGQN